MTQYTKNNEQRNQLREKQNKEQRHSSQQHFIQQTNNFRVQQQQQHQRQTRLFANILSNTFFVKFQLISFFLIYSISPSFSFIIPHTKHGKRIIKKNYNKLFQTISDLLIYNSGSESDSSSALYNDIVASLEDDNSNSLKLHGSTLILDI